MDVQAAGAGHVGLVAQLHRPLQHSGPGHSFPVPVQRHGVGDKLKAVIQAAIVLGVGQRMFPVGQLQQFPRTAGDLPAVVHLQLYPKVAGALPIENGLWLVVVILDHLGFTGVIAAVVAEGLLLRRVVLGITGVVHMDHSVAADAVGIVPVIAALAQGDVLIPGVVILPDTLPTGRAEIGLLFGAVPAELLAVHDNALRTGVGISTAVAGKGLGMHAYSSFLVT